MGPNLLLLIPADVCVFIIKSRPSFHINTAVAICIAHALHTYNRVVCKARISYSCFKCTDLYVRSRLLHCASLVFVSQKSLYRLQILVYISS